MCKGRELTERMRTTILPALPEKAFLRRDRDGGLFISNAPMFTQERIAIPGFDVERIGRLVRIRPDVRWIEEVEANNPEDFFCRSLERFRGDKPDKDAIALFCEGLKLLDAGESVSREEIIAFDRNVRQLAAAALRGGASGGGLYALSLLDAWLKT